jgi:hypothetical protein
MFCRPIMVVRLYYWNYSGDRGPRILFSRAAWCSVLLKAQWLLHVSPTLRFKISPACLSPPNTVNLFTLCCDHNKQGIFSCGKLNGWFSVMQNYVLNLYIEPT